MHKLLCCPPFECDQRRLDKVLPFQGFGMPYMMDFIKAIMEVF